MPPTFKKHLWAGLLAEERPETGQIKYTGLTVKWRIRPKVEAESYPGKEILITCLVISQLHLYYQSTVVIKISYLQPAFTETACLPADRGVQLKPPEGQRLTW